MFEFVERRQKESIVLIPGWAFDCRIFGTLDLPYNYFLYRGNNLAFNFEKSLKKVLREKNIKEISLFGWSQGAFLACDFASKNPELIREIILISAKRRYEKEVLENIKGYIKKNKKAYLYRFYKDCFAEKEKDSLSFFKKEFLEYYLGEMQEEGLTNGLECLFMAEIKPKALKKVKKIKIIHGKEDKIALFREAAKISEALPGARLIAFENTGHLPFLRKDFAEAIHDEGV